MKRRKLWLGLSTAILAAPGAADAAPASGAALVVAQAHGEKGHAGHGGAKAAPPTASASGEGGEGGEGGSAARLPPGLRLSRGLGLIRGHLTVGDELVRGGRWADALPHFLHPTEEVYGGIQGDLKTFDVPPFEAALKSLAQTVKARNKDAYARARRALDERLVAADRSLRGREANWPFLTVETALELLKSAAAEYEAALDGDRVANVVEYQDSRGFVIEAERVLGTAADELGRKDADAFRAVQAAITEARRAWPEVDPPGKAVKAAASLLADVSRVELQLGRLR